MKANGLGSSVLAVAFSFYNAVLAQDFATHGMYTEPNTGMTFYASYQTNDGAPGGMLDGRSWGGFTDGIALPPSAATTDATEYIGLIVGSTPTGPGNGWAGVLQGTEDADGFMWAGMVRHLMVVAWPTGNGNQIYAGFKVATTLAQPIPYEGTAVLTQLYSNVNATHWTLIYRCQGCFTLNDPNFPTEYAHTSKGSYLRGFAQSLTPVTNKLDGNSPMLQHDNGCGWYQIQVASAVQASYSAWATATPTGVPTSTSSSPPTSSTTSAGFSSTPVPTSVTYDYVVVGSGAGGIPIAEKLAASGKSVLLIEKGVASSARHGGTMRPPSGWLDGKNLTWFDVPGQCNRIWNGGSAGVGCDDTDQMAGCILGGGTAINAGLWWKPNPKDWDFNFPTGWKASDMAAATSRVFSRIPGTDLPSKDGKRYLLEGFNVVKTGLLAAGWKSVTANNVPTEKNRTFCHTPYMFANGERGGPQATYLVASKARPNFKLWLNTTVDRIQRTSGHATGLVVRASNNGGYAGEIKLTPITGRVIISAGAFGTPKLLFRSGIGPTDQLNIVKSSIDGPLMINSSYWINSPVGYNLDDHLNTDLVLSHPNVTYYDWPASWTSPITADKDLYFNQRSGPFAQSAPNIGPIMFEEIKGPDGIIRQFQWQARVEGSRGQPNGKTMTVSVWLGRGKVSRGRATINSRLTMEVSVLPFGDTNDMATLAKAIDNMVAALAPVKNLTWLLPPTGQTGAQYLATVPLTLNSIGERRSNHWIGTAKMGTDSGPQGGTSVVDIDTKVYGTDNIFVVDASIFPGMVTTNPSALIVTAAEKASERILALPAVVPIAKWQQCGGVHYNGAQVCAAGSTCQFQNPYYWQCL